MAPSATTTVTVSLPQDRYYTAVTYLLPSDDEERARLQKQHNFLKALGFQLLPDSLVLTSGDRILDAGTGSGTWAMDVARAVPAGVHVTGIDIEKKLFPTPLPNTEFFVQSSLSLPSEWSSTFSLIHQRLMVCAFSEAAWKSSISEFYRVLKPGGQIKLLEIDVLRIASDELATPPLTAKWEAAADQLCKARGIDPRALLKVSKIMQDAGFEDVLLKRVNGYMSEKNHRECAIGSQRGVKGPFMKLGGFGLAKTGEEFDAFMDSMEEEWESTNMAWLWMSWTASKPSN